MKFIYFFLSLIKTMQILLILFYLQCINQSTSINNNNYQIDNEKTQEYKDGWNQERVLAIPKPNRPDPSIYLHPTYIENQLAKFHLGASKIATKITLDYFGYEKIGDPSGQFVITKQEMDTILFISDGNVTLIEQALGIPIGGWQAQELFRIDIENPQKFNLRIPSGNERGANDLWIPGGVLQNGIVEAVIDQIETGQYQLYTINLQA